MNESRYHAAVSLLIIKLVQGKVSMLATPSSYL